MHFKIKGPIREIELLSLSRNKNLNRLNKMYGKASWRKIKVMACRIELDDGAVLHSTLVRGDT